MSPQFVIRLVEILEVGRMTPVSALLSARKLDHPLGCHWLRIPDYVVLEELAQMLVFGCTYLRI